MEICKLNDQNTGSKNGSTNDNMWSILLVDDDRTCLSVVASLLKGCSYQVLTAKDPLDALCILRTGAIKFDLIISDVHMPGMDGFELQRRIHREFQIPVVLMSGDREASNLCEGIRSGASFFVVKPITTEDLKSIWNFGYQWKKKLAKGKNVISDDSYDKDNEEDIGNKLHGKNSKRKLQITKKNKVIWTPYLHGKFVEAMQHLGPEKSVPRNILTAMKEPSLKREHITSHLQKFNKWQKKLLEAEHDPDMLKTLQNGNRWSSSFLNDRAVLGYGQSKLLTNPGLPPSGLMNGTYQMYQPQTPEFSSIESTYQSTNEGNKDMPNADKGQTNLDENDNQDYYVRNNFGSGDAFLANKDMPNADKVHTNLDEKHDNGGIANSADNTETFDSRLEGNQPSDDNQQGMGDDIWAWFRSEYLEDDDDF